eukprot:478478-Prorocentrum_minimum.AAC.1
MWISRSPQDTQKLRASFGCPECCANQSETRVSVHTQTSYRLTAHWWRCNPRVYEQEGGYCATVIAHMIADV